MRLEDLPPQARAKIERQVAASVPRTRRRKPIAAIPATDFEAILAFQLAAAGLPKFETQYRFAPGRDFRSDFAFTEFRLLVEVQGGVWRRKGGAHSRPKNILRDIEKSQLAVINGWALFPVSTDEVKSGDALKLIEIALKAKGWKP